MNDLLGGKCCFVVVMVMRSLTATGKVLYKKSPIFYTGPEKKTVKQNVVFAVFGWVPFGPIHKSSK